MKFFNNKRLLKVFWVLFLLFLAFFIGDINRLRYARKFGNFLEDIFGGKTIPLFIILTIGISSFIFILIHYILLLKNKKSKPVNIINVDEQFNFNPKYAIIVSIIGAISVFLPWVEASASASYMGYSSSWSSGNINGISMAVGIVGLLLMLLGGYLSYKKIRWSFIIGLLNTFDGIGYAIGWIGANSTFKSSYDSYASGRIEPKFGLYLFIISSITFTLFTIKLFKNKKNKV